MDPVHGVCACVCAFERKREDEVFCGLCLSLGSSLIWYLVKAGYRKVPGTPFLGLE